MMERIPCVIMRGGTSKCLVFHARDLPADPKERDALLLAAMGSPDPRQIDGLGGAISTSSKVCIVGPPSVPGADVDYTFGQVSITSTLIDYKGNCGNCSSAIGPFAVDEGLVSAVEGITRVRIYNTNTKKIIRAEVPVSNGRFDPEGETHISGVPRAGSRITMWFDDPEGAVTGKLLPTGSASDWVDVPGVGKVEISVVDAANPLVFVRAEDLGITGTESPAALDEDAEFSRKIEAVRSVAAVLCGLVDDWTEATAKSPAVPKATFVAPPRDYVDTSGSPVKASEMDLLARIMSMQTVHRAFALTGGVAVAAAALIPGSVVNGVIRPEALLSGRIRLGHPGGCLDLEAKVEGGPNGLRVKSVGAVRTARRLMEGHVYVPQAVQAKVPGGKR